MEERSGRHRRHAVALETAAGRNHSARRPGFVADAFAASSADLFRDRDRPRSRSCRRWRNLGRADSLTGATLDPRGHLTLDPANGARAQPSGHRKITRSLQSPNRRSGESCPGLDVSYAEYLGRPRYRGSLLRASLRTGHVWRIRPSKVLMRVSCLPLLERPHATTLKARWPRRGTPDLCLRSAGGEMCGVLYETCDGPPRTPGGGHRKLLLATARDHVQPKVVPSTSAVANFCAVG